LIAIATVFCSLSGNLLTAQTAAVDNKLSQTITFRTIPKGRTYQEKLLKGKWTISKGIKSNSAAAIYGLESGTGAYLYLLKGDETGLPGESLLGVTGRWDWGSHLHPVNKKLIPGHFTQHGKALLRSKETTKT
jgi:hypothetical protein